MQSKCENDRVVLRVNRHGVTHAAVLQDLLAALAGVAPILYDVVRQDRAQLFDRQGKVSADARQFRNQRARARRHGDAALLGDVDGRLADKRGVGQSLRCHQLPRQRFRFRRRQEVATLILELTPRFRLDGLIHHHRVGR